MFYFIKLKKLKNAYSVNVTIPFRGLHGLGWLINCTWRLDLSDVGIWYGDLSDVTSFLLLLLGWWDGDELFCVLIPLRWWMWVTWRLFSEDRQWWLLNECKWYPIVVAEENIKKRRTWQLDKAIKEELKSLGRRLKLSHIRNNHFLSFNLIK